MSLDCAAVDKYFCRSEKSPFEGGQGEVLV
jgi:hypothetical protein